MTVTPDVGRVKTIKQTYKWEISRCFLVNMSVGDYLESVEFSTNSKNYKWKICLYPKGYNEISKDYYSIGIYNCGIMRRTRAVTAIVSLSIINQNDEKIALCSFVIENEFWYRNYPSYHHVCKKFVKQSIIMDEANKILTNGQLIIKFKVDVDSPQREPNQNMKRKSDQTDVNLQQLLKIRKLENLMNDKEYCDISFLVDGKTFKAHKCILAKESPVFDAMFKIDMKEKLLNEVIIEDIRPDIFEKLLRYMYVGEVEDIHQAITVELLVAADKYAIDELKLKCGQTLIDNLSIDTAVESLMITDRYNMRSFKATVIQFITSHSTDIVITPNFKLLTAIPHVLYEVCLAVGMKK
ncbi:hypothetical protein TSAR_003067 [Trichomalopsis sarcophagae]|uniref:BTB domain-containing protein n=1 Tax=Trichomalopsis sarcophagae TaxID=543379 RepID=A0A232FLK2_9HYME|nr:hypothetical protein TSAR_003067 [Trichomalopsis sarcophagae]